MEFNTIGTTSATPSPVTGPPASSGAKISSDFETFLKMLTVQMQNQDPLNPVDSADYATQLATFSGVEQQVQTNDLLRSLSGQLGTGGLSQLAGWVGMQVRAQTPAWFDGAPITVATDVQRGADEAQLVVRDASGAEVQRVRIETDDGPVAWPGIGSDGRRLPAGYYTFETVSVASGVVVAETASEIYATVTEVQVKDGVNTLVLAGGGTIPAAAVTAVREAAPL